MKYDIPKLLDYCEQSRTNISPQDDKDWAMFADALKALNYGEPTFVALSNPGTESVSRAKWRSRKRPWMNPDAAAAKIVALARDAGVDLTPFRLPTDPAELLAEAAAKGKTLPSDADTARKLFAAMQLLGLDLSLFPRLAGRWEGCKVSHSVFRTPATAASFIRLLCSQAIQTANSNAESTALPAAAAPSPAEPPVYLDPAELDAAEQLLGRSSLYLYLCSHFTPEDVQRVFRAYRAGSTARFARYWPGDGFGSVFPLINSEGRVVDAHLMAYALDGHRRKDETRPYRCQAWALHTKDLSHRRAAWPLFGEHLLAARPDAAVGIVESEKTALVAALAAPAFVWCATLSISNLNARRLAAARGRRIMLFPDCDGCAAWEAKAETLRRDDPQGYGQLVVCSDFVRSNAKQPKDDIADLLLNASV